MLPEVIDGYRRTSKATSDPVRAKQFREDFAARGFDTMQKKVGSKIYLYVKDNRLKGGAKSNEQEELQHDRFRSEDGV
jgi:hypothetical protein